MSRAKAGMYDGERNPMYGRRHGAETRERMRRAKVGRKWIRMDAESKCVPESELESYVLAGWRVGRPTTSRRRPSS